MALGPRKGVAGLLALAAIAAIAAPGVAVRGQVLSAGGSGTATSINVQTLSTGTVLQVTPAVSPDGRYVTLGVDTQFSTLGGIDTFVVSQPPAGGRVGAGRVFVGGNGMGMQVATEVRSVPFRPAQVGRVTFVDHDAKLLAVTVAGMELKGAGFKDAVQKVADASRQNIVLGIRGLAQAGVDVSTPRDFSIPAGSVKQALVALAEKAAPQVDMVIVADENVITMETQAQADRAMVTRVYALQDLLANLPRFVAGGTDLGHLGQAAGKDAGLLAARDFFAGTDVSRPPELSRGQEPAPAKPARAVAEKRPATASTDITELITSTVRPEIWRVHGGKADISVYGDKVVIDAPESVHALLAGPSHGDANAGSSYVLYGQ